MDESSQVVIDMGKSIIKIACLNIEVKQAIFLFFIIINFPEQTVRSMVFSVRVNLWIYCDRVVFGRLIALTLTSLTRVWLRWKE